MLNKMANEARKSIIKMIYEAKSGHPGGYFILYWYFNVLVPKGIKD